MGYAVGVIKLSFEEFYDFRPVEFEEVAKAFNEYRTRSERVEYECMRLQTLYLVNVQLPAKDRKTNATDFMPLPWDSEVDNNKEVTEVSKEVVDSMIGSTLDLDIINSLNKEK